MNFNSCSFIQFNKLLKGYSVDLFSVRFVLLENS